jgi:hypothetical protein
MGKSVHGYAGNSRAVVFIYGYGNIRIAFEVRKALAGKIKMLNIELCKRQIRAKLMFLRELILLFSQL